MLSILFNKNKCKFYFNNKFKILKGNPKQNIEKIIENFKFDLPKNLPPISSIISGYFSYDIIRYIENIPNTTKNDLNIPDSRILRPKEIIIHDNFDKKLYFIVNVYKDEKINNFKKKLAQINKQIEEMVFLANFNTNSSYAKLHCNSVKIKSNVTKKKIFKKY